MLNDIINDDQVPEVCALEPLLTSQQILNSFTQLEEAPVPCFVQVRNKRERLER